jgi:hypothetical protein
MSIARFCLTAVLLGLVVAVALPVAALDGQEGDKPTCSDVQRDRRVDGTGLDAIFAEHGVLPGNSLPEGQASTSNEIRLAYVFDLLKGVGSKVIAVRQCMYLTDFQEMSSHELLVLC